MGGAVGIVLEELKAKYGLQFECVHMRVVRPGARMLNALSARPARRRSTL